MVSSLFRTIPLMQHATCNNRKNVPVTAMSWGKTLNVKARYLAGGLVRVNPTFALTKHPTLVGANP